MSDLLQLFSEVTCEKIFSFLSVKDLLTCLLINKSYCKFISKSPRCMKRIKLYLNHSVAQELDEFMRIFNESSRNYCNIETINYSIDFFNAVMSNQNFKSIKMKRIMVHGGDELDKFFTKINKNIEELILERFIETDVVVASIHKQYLFLKLRHLELNYIPPLIFNVFTNCTNLRTLKITGKRKIEYYNLLRRNQHLEKLIIVTDEIDNYFEENIAEYVQFKLKYFEARDIYNLTSRCIENFKKFLEKQLNSLLEIDFGDWISTDLVKMIFHMPRLKKLTFKGFHNVEEGVNMNEINFHKSKSITQLYLIDTFSKLDLLKAFIQACPHTVKLKLYSLKKDALIFLSEALPNLKELTIDLLEINYLDTQIDFVKLEKFSMKVCYQNLQISEVGSNNFINLVKNEVINMEKRNKVKFTT